MPDAAEDPAGIAIRRARPEELAAAGRVVADAYRVIVGDRHDGYLAEIRDAAARAEVCPVLVAVDVAGRVLGSVTYVPDASNPFAEVEREGEAGFRMLGVAPDAQGRGIGQRLVLACLDRARADGRHAVAITTTAAFREAQRLYRRLGFRRAPDRDFGPVPGVRLLAFVLDL